MASGMSGFVGVSLEEFKNDSSMQHVILLDE